MGGPIPWTAIKQYADAYGLAGDAFERLVALVRAIETAGEKAK